MPPNAHRDRPVTNVLRFVHRLALGDRAAGGLVSGETTSTGTSTEACSAAMTSVFDFADLPILPVSIVVTVPCLDVYVRLVSLAPGASDIAALQWRHCAGIRRGDTRVHRRTSASERRSRSDSKTAKAHHSTVGVVREEMESTGEISQLPKTICTLIAIVIVVLPHGKAADELLACLIFISR